MANTKLTRTNGTSTNLKKWTWSAWIKRGIIGTQETFVVSRNDDNNYSRIRTDPDVLQFEDRISSSTNTDIKSNEKFRDPNAWMHVVVRIDYTQSSAADRARMYVNGTEVTYSSTTRQSQDGNSYFNDAVPHALGHYNDNNYFQGCMSHVHFCDGYSYAPTEFGETDSTTGQWKIKTAPSVTYGNNGYFVLKDGNGVTDQSGNSNNFTVGSGTLTTLQDCPSDNFAVFNPLIDPASSSQSFNNGNTRIDQDTSGWGTAISSLAAVSGKFYAEFKASSLTTNGMLVGIVEEQYQNNLNYVGVAGAIGYHYNGQVYNRDSNASFGNAYAQGDIIGVAMDLTNKFVYFSKNGTWQNSGDPTSGSSGTGGIAIGGSTGSAYFFGLSIYNSGYHGEANFGNGYFGTTAISSEGTNASGIGKFEYDVPAGYTALSTKGLNE
tara:strand:- start:243 stop:1547 length:1305 start_codon:yes stop_codon:yes gene_type:complete